MNKPRNPNDPDSLSLAPDGTTQYTVQEGDTLSRIAQARYGKAGQWQRIFQANRDQLDDPDRIQPGQVLKIPAVTREDDGSTTPPHGDTP